MTDTNRPCEAENTSQEFVCTRELGHDGPHVAATCDLQYSICEVWGTTEPRPLTADDITDAMVKRARGAWAGANVNLTRDGFVREVLTAALTEPRRPEGAETLAFDLDEAHKGGGDVQDEADRLYAMGYRKVES